MQGAVNLFLLLALYTYMLCCVVGSREIRLNRWLGDNNATCLEGSYDVPCRTLEFIAEGVQNNCMDITIVLETDSKKQKDTKQPFINQNVTFINCYNLSIIAEKSFDVKCENRQRKTVGFIFRNITGLQMKNLNFRSCQRTFQNFSAAAVQVHNSKDVSLKNVHFSRSRTIAVVFVNTFGAVTLADCSFKRNKLFKQELKRQVSSYPGGVYIEFTENKPGAVYSLRNCSFITNKAPITFLKFSPSKLIPENDWRGLGLGGGLAILFTNVSNGNNISILNSNFTANTATWGAGMYIHYQGEVANNTVVIDNTTFERNKAYEEGGGMDIGFLQDSPSHNRLIFTNCTIFENTANVGGGVSLFAIHGSVKSTPGESVIFQNCTWANNTGKLSSAIDIAPSRRDRLGQGFLPVPVFKDCQFFDNVLSIEKEKAKGYKTATFHQYSGIFTITKATAVFQGITTFNNNKFTALRITSSRIVFEKQSKVTFLNNHGSVGGAIAFFGFSSLVFKEDSSFEFTNNFATSAGGALYYESFDQHDFTYARSCFLQYNGSNLTVEERNVNFTFVGNKAETGTSIYSTSFYPCFYEWFDTKSKHYTTDFFQKIANFAFDGHTKNPHSSQLSRKDLNNSLATIGRRFQLEGEYTNSVDTIPGKKVSFPLIFLDEFGQARKTVYAFSVEANTSEIAVDPKYTVDTSTSFYGQGKDFTFLVSANNLRRVSARFGITSIACPPGFYFANDPMACKCAADNPAKAFVGMTRCNSAAYVAYIQYGYWGGYDSPNKFQTALCPLTFCALTTNASNPRNLHALPNSSSSLNDVMCGKSRKGILCGECQENNSVYYHSSHFMCKPNHLCNVGFLFYVLSELVPTVILFSVIIAYDISFTQGSMNGFIFFSQVLDTITLNMRLFHEKIEQTTSFFNMLYGILNLDFFSFESLSFCLWEGATVMDILAFKYIAVVFALLLVIGLILLMNSQLCSKLHKKASKKLSIIHGMSAFLVICYTQCTKISFYILTRVVLEGEGGTSGPVVTFFGGIPYFKGKHLAYVFPAIFCLVTITIIPPLLLFLYPLLYQLLSLCGLSEHYIVTKISNVLSIHKMMPIFDSFQSCYKDKLRFFAGLYFIYRIVILATYSISHSVTQFHIVVGLLILVIMGIHSFTHPYKKSAHNRIDSLLFLNLELINAILLLSIVFSIESKEDPDYLNRNTVLTLVSTSQMILILLPMASFASWLIFKTIRKCITCFRKWQNDTLGTSTTVENNDLDDLLVTRDLGENDNIDGQYFELADYENQQQNTY